MFALGDLILNCHNCSNLFAKVKPTEPKPKQAKSNGVLEVLEIREKIDSRLAIKRFRHVGVTTVI